MSRRALIVAIGLCSLLGLVAVLELAARMIVPDLESEARRSPLKLVESRALTRAHKLHDRPELAITPGWGTPRFAARTQTFSFTPHRYRNDGSRQDDKDVGVVLRPNSTGRTTKVRLNGEVLFDVRFQADTFGRRQTPLQDDHKRRGNVLFFGSSDAFGHGIQDTETMPAQLAQAQGNFRVYNYALEAWGPNNVLRLVQTRKIGEQVPAAPTIAVYWLSSVYLARTVPSLKLYRGYPYWLPRLPSFELERGELVSHGMLADRAQHWVWKFFGRSHLMALLGVEYPGAYAWEDFELTAALLAETKRVLAETLNLERFVVVFPAGHPLDWVRVSGPLLRARGIETLDYHAVDLSHYLAEDVLTADYHPTPAAIKLWMQQLAKDLRL